MALVSFYMIDGEVTHLHTDTLLDEHGVLEKVTRIAGPGVLIDLLKVRRWKCGCPKFSDDEVTYLCVIQSKP